MDDIKKLRNLLRDIDGSIDFSKYDKKINDYYLKDFNERLIRYNFDSNYFVVCNTYFEGYKEYFDKLDELKEMCNEIVRSGYSLNNCVINKNMYKNGKLTLDKISNIEYLIEQLKTFTSKGNIYSNINNKEDFSILKKGVTTSISVNKIKVKRKYYKMERRDVVGDILKKYDNYYIEDACFDSFFASFNKVKTKRKINHKISFSFVKGVILYLLPPVILLCVSLYCLKRFNVIIPSIDLSFEDVFSGEFDVFSLLQPVIPIAVLVAVFVGACFISRILLNSLPFYKGVKAYFMNILSIIANLLLFFLEIKGNIKILGVCAVIGACGLFMGFFAGPDFRKISKKEQSFSLIGRLIVSLVFCDIFFIIIRDNFSKIAVIVLLVLAIYGAALGNIYKRVSNSPWYGRQ